MHNKKQIVGATIVIATLGVLAITVCKSQRKDVFIERYPRAANYIDYDEELADMKEFPQYNDNDEFDIRSANLSNLDLTKLGDELERSSFDSKTTFPKKLPEGFDPDAIMENGKKECLGLGVKEVHEEGITGKGVGIAVIDGPLLVDHKEYKNELVYYKETERISEDREAEMHGTAISSIAVGKSIGVAPGASLYYIADDLEAFVEDNSILAEDIRSVLELNKTLDEEHKIRVISISTGMESEETKGYDEYMNALKEAKDQGVFVISTTLDEREDMKGEELGYMGLSKIHGQETEDNGEKASYKFAFWTIEGVNDGEKEDNARWYQKQLCVPMDEMTTASPTGTSDYVFYYHGGLSWSTPYIAGVYALACEKDPDITYDVFWQKAMDTADHVYNGDNGELYEISHIINVKKLIDSI